MKTFREHYEECKRIYGNKSASVYDLTVSLNPLKFDLDNFNLLSKEIRDRLEDGLGCTQDQWAIKLNEWKNIESLSTFCSEVMPQIEETVFGCYLKIEHIHPYRVKHDTTRESSWSWHYDDCPKEFIKLAVYLNNVRQYSGCMQVLLGPDETIPVIDTYRLDPTAVKGFPPPVFPKTRIPTEFLTNFRKQGGKFFDLTGDKGTHFIFTPNVVHRGTIPVNGFEPRDAIFFFLRPSMVKIENYIECAHSFLPEKNVKKYELD